MKEWFKRQTAMTKALLVVILLLIVGIIVRWDYVSGEVAEAFSSRMPSADIEAAEAAKAEKK